MGSAIAMKEGTPLVPGTPTSVSELKEELWSLERNLGASNRLEYFRHAIRQGESLPTQQAAYYLLHLSFEQRTIVWSTFKWNESQEANAKYTDLEQKVSGNPGEFVVLVRAASLSAMKRAYPGFFLDTELFLRLLGEALGSLDAPAAVAGA
jgi:hypothetical protein